MLDKERCLNDDDKQFKFLQEGSNRILSKAQILCVLFSHELLSTLHITHQFTYFIYLFCEVEFKFERIQESNNYIKHYQGYKIDFFMHYIFKLKLPLNLNIKSDFQGNS